MKGLVTQTLDWITHPYYSESDLTIWAAFLVLALIASFGWAVTVKALHE